MVKPELQNQQANHEVWLNAAIEFLRERGVGRVKIVFLADRPGLTSGTFY